MVRRGAGGNGEKCQPSGLSAEGGNDSEFRQPTSGAHASAGRADRLPRGKHLAFGGVRPLCHECKGCSFHGFFVGFDARRFPKGERKALWCARRRSPIFPYEGLTRRRRRGSGTCRPMGLSHFSFDGERKVCKRKPAARRLREKGFYCPFWRRGSLCRAQHDWPDFTCDPARSELAFFCRQNGRAFFPPLPIAALAPRGRRRAYLTLAG